MYRLSFIFLIIISVSFGLLLSCGGGDDTGSSGSASKETARIVGTVEDLVLASGSKSQKTIAFRFKNLLALVPDAKAQDGPLCGILVKAIQDGVVVATAETNCEGEFELNEVPAGPTILMFETDLFMDILELNVPVGGTVDIKVSLDDDEGTQVSVNEINIITGPVACEDGVLNIGSDDIDELTIIGNGGNCVNVEGSCDVSIIAGNVNLAECDVCINAVNGAFVSVTALEEFDCNADIIGINSAGDSDVVLGGDKCTIESGESQIIEEEGGEVNTEECEEVNLEEGESDGGDDGGNRNPVCEYECAGNNCELFCTDGIPDECTESCANSDNISNCVQECTGLECGFGQCNEVCLQEGEPHCEVVEEEVCEEVCEGECEEECIEFRKEEVLNEGCFVGCINGECEGLEGGDREECVASHEPICADVCTELVETDDCIEWVIVGCECEEVCEVVEEEVCEGGGCIEEGIACRFECE